MTKTVTIDDGDKDETPEAFTARLKGVMELIAEECAETIQEAMKASRFGLDSPGGTSGKGPTAREGLVREMGDQAAVTDLAVAHGFLDRGALEARRARKFAFLTGPAALANNGRHLAPLPPSALTTRAVAVLRIEHESLTAETAGAGSAEKLGLALIQALLSGQQTTMETTAMLKAAGIDLDLACTKATHGTEV